MTDIRKAMAERILFCDGGMGSLLQAKGLKPGELPGIWNVTHPEVLVEIHRAYLEAGRSEERRVGKECRL